MSVCVVHPFILRQTIPHNTLKQHVRFGNFFFTLLVSECNSLIHCCHKYEQLNTYICSDYVALKLESQPLSLHGQTSTTQDIASQSALLTSTTARGLAGCLSCCCSLLVHEALANEKKIQCDIYFC